MNPVAMKSAELETAMIHLAGTPTEIGEIWGHINRESIHHDMHAFFLKPAREAGLSEQTLIERAKRYVDIVEKTAVHWLDESAAIASSAGVDANLYLSFVAGIYRNLFLQPECTSYAVQSAATHDHAIFFHKTRDNVDKAQCAFVMNSQVPGINRFIATSDASVAACMMMVNEKGLAGSADYPGGLTPVASPPRHRGMMNAQLLRHIAERAEDCASALEIVREFVDREYYAGGNVNTTHWLFVDRTGTILEISNNTREVLAQRHTDKVYFSRLRESSAAQRLLEVKHPIDFALFHGVSRNPAICLNTSISGMTVEIDREHPDLFSCAWISVPARSVSFPLFMGQKGTPSCLLDGSAYQLGKTTGDHSLLWERIEGGVYASQNHLKRSVMTTEFRHSFQEPGNAIEQWSQAQSAMLLSVLQALKK
jgi:hypothetical protein